MQQYGPFLAIGLILVGVTALIVARISTRWLGLAMLLWLALPVILMAAVLTIGSALSPAQGSTASNAVFAAMIVGLAMLVPWVVICLIGFAIGIVMRRKRATPEPVGEEPKAPELTSSVPPAQIAAAFVAARPPEHRLAADAPNPHFSHNAPDGSLRIDIEPVEWTNSQWVHTPRVIEAVSGRILCDLLGSDWEGQTAFPRDRYVWLGLRRYRTPGHLFAEFDLDADRYRIALTSLDSPDEEGPLGDISERLEHWWERATALAMDGAPMPQPAPRPHPFAAWRAALVILVGAIAAIAGLTFLSEKTGFEPPRIPILRPGTGVPH